MYPTLLEIGELRFHAYTVMLSVSFVLGILLGVRENYRLVKPYPITPAGGLVIFFAAMVCTRAWWIVQYSDEPWALWRAFFFWQGGLVFYGGALGGFLGGVIYLRWVKAPVVGVGDVVIPFLPMAHGLARIGCFLNGCCWGSPCDLPWAVQFPNRSWGAYRQHLDEGWIDHGAAHSLPVHPTQLYATIGLLCIFAFLLYASRRRWHDGRPGLILLLYPLLYGLLRFGLEFVRADNEHLHGGLTTSQLVALGLFGFGAGAMVLLECTLWPYLRKRGRGRALPRRNTRAAAEENWWRDEVPPAPAEE